MRWVNLTKVQVCLGPISACTGILPEESAIWPRPYDQLGSKLKTPEPMTAAQVRHAGRLSVAPMMDGGDAI